MSNQPPPSGEDARAKGPRGMKLSLILLMLMSFFAFVLYLIFSHPDGFSGPAQVGQVKVSPESARVAQVQTPSDVPPYSGVSASPSSPSPDRYAYLSPRSGDGRQKKQPAVPSVGSSRTTASPEATMTTEELAETWREYQEARRDEEAFRTSRGSTAVGSSDRLLPERRQYAQDYERSKLARLRRFEEVHQSVAILSYPDVRGLQLSDALQKPEFEIKIRTANKLQIQGVSIESGEYSLKPKFAGGKWYLLFMGSHDATNPARLTLNLEHAAYNSDKLIVAVHEFGKKAFIEVRLGNEKLTGYFEVNDE